MKLAYSIFFVPDVEATVDFYERAFGLKRQMMTPQFGQMDTGSTALAFGAEANEEKELGKTSYRKNRPDDDPAAAQISFVTNDVQAAYDRAIAAGATSVYGPRQMPWGQTVSRVRDLNGVLVGIVTELRM